MKTSDINEILRFFCQNQNYRAILIDGKWGIGKTYEFKKYFDSLKRKDKKRIYYFTIFGTETIDELNTSIFRKIHPLWSYFRVGYNTISKSIDAVTGIKSSSLNVHVNLDYLLDLAKPQNIRKNPILIFDDIERFNNDNFSLFLGLLYKLNLQGAKIICFTSSEKLKDKEKIFQEYKEKVFDAVYKIEEPSLNVFNTTFDIIKDNDKRRYLLDKCQMNIRFLKKGHLLFNRIIEKVGNPNNWSVDPYFVILSCCYAVQIVLSFPSNVEEIDKSDFGYFSKSEEFGEDIARNFATLIKNEELDKTDNLIPGLISCILRLYLFDDYESLKCSILKQQENERSLLSHLFFFLSDENKEKYVSLFTETINDTKFKYDKNYLQMLGDIIRYYEKDINADLISKFVEKYFSACDKEKELEFSELTHWFENLKSISNGQEKKRIDTAINIIDAKLEQLIKEYHTSAILIALKSKNYIYLDHLINRFTLFQNRINIADIREEVIKHDFYLPNLSEDISQNEWYFAHEIVSVVHLLELDVQFINYVKEKTKKCESYTLKNRLEALIEQNVANFSK